jgi:hypothetical protein
MSSTSIEARFTPNYFYAINDHIVVYINYIVINQVSYYFFASINTKSYRTFVEWQKASNTPRNRRTKEQKKLLETYSLRRIKIPTKEIKDMHVSLIEGQPKPIKADNKRYASTKYEDWINGGLGL